MDNNIWDMSLIEILEYIRDTYGNDETTNLYIRCLDCDEYIPVCEWDQHEDLLEFEKCQDCKEDDEQFLGDEEDDEETGSI